MAEVPAGLEALVKVDVWVTVAFGVLAAAAAALAGVVGLVYAGASLVLFAIGMVAFVWAYAVAVGRSRFAYISTVGVYFLTGDVVAPAARSRLLAALAAQVVISIAAASVRPFTAVAFGILVPMFGLGMAGLAGARFGSFEEREQADPPQADAGAGER